MRIKAVTTSHNVLEYRLKNFRRSDHCIENCRSAIFAMFGALSEFVKRDELLLTVCIVVSFTTKHYYELGDAYAETQVFLDSLTTGSLRA